MEESKSRSTTTKISKDSPYLISLPKFGSSTEGFLITTQYADNLPFAVKRVFWVQQVPFQRERGDHACYKTEMILISLQGKVEVQTKAIAGSPQNFLLENSNQGLYIPAKCWLKLLYSKEAILLCLASTDYSEKDYIWDYDIFRNCAVSEK